MLIYFAFSYYGCRGEVKTIAEASDRITAT